MKKTFLISICIIYVFGNGYSQIILSQDKNSIIFENKKTYTKILTKAIVSPSASELVYDLIEAQNNIQLLAEMDIKEIARKYSLDKSTLNSVEKLVNLAKLKMEENNNQRKIAADTKEHY